MIEKTQYFSILKQLHDVCRNNPAPSLTGMDAYNEIMNFLCLRHMSDNKPNGDYTLKYLYEEYCTGEKIDEDTKNENYKKSGNKSGKEVIFNYELLSKDFLPRTIKSSENKNIGFVKIMGDEINNLKVSVGRLTFLLYKEDGAELLDGGKKAQRLINKIYEKDFLPLDAKGKFNLNLFPYDGIGEGYEKFMKDAGQEGGNAGQYFTNIQVVNYILKKIKVKPTDKVIDPFAGSGGFILPIKKLGVKNENIYAREQDDKIYKFLRFNSLIAELEVDNIMKGDSFDYHDSLEQYENFFDIVVSNPPYGMSIDINLEGDDKKLKYWNVIKASKKNTIKDSMGLSLYSIIKSLKSGGQSGIVTERGILNNGTDTNSWQKKLRKYLLENTNVKEILLLPKGIFSYTNFDTGIIIFEKGKKTEKIVFNEGYFKDEDKGKGNKIMHIKENILTITIKDIVNKDWSLKYDDYVEKKENLHAGIEYKTLGEVCEFTSGKTISKDIIDKNTGEYPVIGGGIKPFGYYNKYNILENKLLVSKSGANAGYISKYNTKVWASDCFSIDFVDKKSNSEKYLFYYLKLNQSKFIQKQEDGGLQSGNAQPHVYEKDLKKLKIPILPKDHQEEIVECVEKIFGSNYKELDKMVSKLKSYNLFNPLLSKNYDDFEKIYDLYKDVCNLEKVYNDRDEHKRALIKKCFKTVKGVEKALGEVCTKILSGNHMDKSKRNEGIVPYYGANGIIGNVSEYLFEGNNDIICAQDGTIGATHLVNGKYNASNHVWIIRETNMNKKYLYNILKFYINYKDTNIISGQAIPKLTLSTLKKLTIPIPSPEDQEKVVKMIELIDKTDSEYNNTIKSIKLMIENIYTNIEMRCEETNSIVEDETNTQDNISEQSTLSAKSAKSNCSSPSTKSPIIKLNGIRCIKEVGNYYKLVNEKKGDLHAITNTNGEIELVGEEEAKEEEEEMDDCSESKYDLVTIKDVDYINLDEKIYTIDETGEPDKLFGTFINEKFQYVKKSNDKIIVKGRAIEKSIEELEAELEA